MGVFMGVLTCPSPSPFHTKPLLISKTLHDVLHKAAMNHHLGKHINWFRIIYSYVDGGLVLYGFAGISDVLLTEHEYEQLDDLWTGLGSIVSPRLNDVLNRLYKAETLARANGHVIGPGPEPEHTDASPGAA
jgi:hypothetical protein